MTQQPSDFGGLFSARRIVVVGANGAGKTWFATRLADHVQLPLVHNDALALSRNWVRLPAAEVNAARAAVAAGDVWIIEGGPSVLAGAVLKRAQLIIWLDPPRILRVWRVLKRTLLYMGRERPEHPPGNREWPGLRQWRFLVKTWTSDAKMRGRIAAALDQLAADVLHLRTPVEVADLLARARDTPRQSTKRFE